MLPISPPLPLIHKTFALLPSSGSLSSILELVFPPPKFVIRRSDPSKFERYRSNSAWSRLFATWSSHLSSRYRSFSLDFRSEEHTSELQSQSNLVCRLLLEKKNNNRSGTALVRARFRSVLSHGRLRTVARRPLRHLLSYPPCRHVQLSSALPLRPRRPATPP